jgi:hypothetical protein
MSTEQAEQTVASLEQKHQACLSRGVESPGNL